MYPMSAPGKAASLWTPVINGSVHVEKATMSSAAFQPITVVELRSPSTMTMPAPGVYVFDFEQNGPGWYVWLCCLGFQTPNTQQKTYSGVFKYL